MNEPLRICGRTLEQWREYARRDDCLDRMVPSDLRELVGAIREPAPAQPENPSAFPRKEYYSTWSEPEYHAGMSLRDYLAGQALAGDWAAQDDLSLGAYTDSASDQFLQERARLFYRMADAMLVARGAK